MRKSDAYFKYIYSEELDSYVLELPYISNYLSFIVILPKKRNGLQELKSVMKWENLNHAINSMTPTPIGTIYLPKFKTEIKYYLKRYLHKKLNIFSNEANFSRMSLSQNLRITKAIHKVFIEVTEKGTEAAAVTVLVSAKSNFYRKDVFNVDHPFIYLIRHNWNGVILFIGQITNF